jgi:hypothetical protein
MHQVGKVLQRGHCICFCSSDGSMTRAFELLHEVLAQPRWVPDQKGGAWEFGFFGCIMSHY